MKKISYLWKWFSKPEQSKNAIEVNEDSKNDNKAHIYNLIIVDESGSMDHLRKATLSGINETIGTIRSAQEEFLATQKHTLTLVTFNAGTSKPDVRTRIDNQPISVVKKFKDYRPNGGTPLYDAMGQSLTTLHERIKGDINASAVVTILTDGMENSSREWDAPKLRSLIEQLKTEGWSFAYMGSAHNVREVTDLLHIENAVEFSHNDTGIDSTWKRECSAKHAYYEKMAKMYHDQWSMSTEEILEHKRHFAREYYSPRVTPRQIDHLEGNEIFVFGSNEDGHHGGGAAAQAMSHFGAIWGQSEGLQGQSYAIPTMEGIREMNAAIQRFALFAAQHRNKRFLVTRIGCGVAGYSATQIAPLFEECIALENVTLPTEFWDILGLRM